MSNRRNFLSNIVLGTVAAPFIGKVTEASKHEVEEFGQPGMVLGERKDISSINSLTLRVYCGDCRINLSSVIKQIDNQELRYHIYLGENFIRAKMIDSLALNDIVLRPEF